MTATEHQNPRTQGRLVRWAWIAVALVPVGWLVVALAGFAGGESTGSSLAGAFPPWSHWPRPRPR